MVIEVENVELSTKLGENYSQQAERLSLIGAIRLFCQHHSLKYDETDDTVRILK